MNLVRGAWRGPVFILVAAVLFGVLGFLVKKVSEQISSAQVVFFRNAIGLLALAPFFWRDGWRALATDRLWDHGVRVFSGVAAMYLSFYAIGRMRLADAFVLSYAAPLYMPFIARIRLKEPIPRGAVGALALGTLGMVVLLKPGWGVFDPVALVAWVSGILAAVAQVSIRHLTRTEPPVRIVFYFGLFSTLLTAPPLVFMKTWPSFSLWCWLGVLGLVATLAQLAMTKGYKHGAPARVGPLMYAAVVVAGLLDWIFWNKTPDRFSFLGIGLIVGACVWVLRGTEKKESTPGQIPPGPPLSKGGTIPPPEFL